MEEKISQSSASLSESTSGVSSVSSTDRPNLRESAKDDSGSTNQQKNSFEDVRALSSADQEKMKKAISKMKKLDEKLASITKVSHLFHSRHTYTHLIYLWDGTSFVF